MVEETKQLYYRDIQLNDVGEDVARAQKFLLELGYAIDAKELEEQRYGDSMAAAKQQLQDDIKANPFKLLGALLRAFFTGQTDALETLLQVSDEDIVDELGDSILSHGDRAGSGRSEGLGGNDGVLGTGKAVYVGNTKQLDYAGLVNLSARIEGDTPGERAANLATRFVGQHEVGSNGGPLVQLVNGYKGDAWCGGFAHYILDQTMPGVFNQADFRTARSFMEVGKKYDAFHKPGSDYTPQVGDAIVFSRGSGKGHVGIVTGYDAETKQMTYVSGNDGNAVRPRTIDMDNPPSRMLGITSATEVAKAKNITVKSPAEHVEEAVAAIATAVPKPKQQKETQAHGKDLKKQGIIETAESMGKMAVSHISGFMKNMGVQLA